jgi:hypothetical protein
MEWAGKLTRMGEKRYTHRVLVEKPEPNNLLNDLRVNKINLKTTGRESLDWINMAHQRDKWRALVNTITSLRVPLDFQERSCSTETAIYTSMDTNKMINGNTSFLKN